jgi:molecular chaperone HscB
MERQEAVVDIHNCWNCKHEVHTVDKCPSCHKILPMVENVDYFSYLGFKKQLNLNLDELEHRFFELSKEYHPDYFSNGSEVEKEISMERASFLNSAYKVLKDPISRAKYLLKLEWGEVSEDKKKVPPEILMEVMALQEKIEEITSEIDNNKKDELNTEIEEIRVELENKMKGLNSELKNLFIKWDGLLSGNTSTEVKQSILKEINKNLSIRAYLGTLISTINK